MIQIQHMLDVVRSDVLEDKKYIVSTANFVGFFLHLSSSECGHVQDPVWLEVFPGVSDAISEDEPPFSIRVVDLDRLPGVEGVDVVGTCGIGSNGIFSETK